MCTDSAKINRPGYNTDQLGRKRCQKKRKDVDYKLLQELYPGRFILVESVLYTLRDIQEFLHNQSKPPVIDFIMRADSLGSYEWN